MMVGFVAFILNGVVSVSTMNLVDRSWAQVVVHLLWICFLTVTAMNIYGQTS